MSGITLLEEKGLRKGSGQQGSQTGQGTFLFNVLGFRSKGHQVSAFMASRARGCRHLTYSGDCQTLREDPKYRGPCSSN